MMNTPASTDNQPLLIAAALEHLACYLQSGRPRSAHLTALLFAHLALDTGVDAELRERCRLLVEVLENQATHEEPLPRAAATRVLARGRPWLTWERLGEAA